MARKSAAIPNVLSIAGSDPSGGAGIQADLKTIGGLGCYGMAVLTSLTVQNTKGVSAVHVCAPDFVAQQIDAVFDDISVDAVKIGVLATGPIASIVAARLVMHQPGIVVLDPVFVATSGDILVSTDCVAAIAKDLLPLATLITPNLPEAARLADQPVPVDVDGMKQLAEALVILGARAVLVKGGHLNGEQATDVLFDGSQMQEFTVGRVLTHNTHGTGDTLSSAIAAYLALGENLSTAIGSAKTYVTEALRRSGALKVGGGHGPVLHYHARGYSLR